MRCTRNAGKPVSIQVLLWFIHGEVSINRLVEMISMNEILTLGWVWIKNRLL